VLTVLGTMITVVFLIVVGQVVATARAGRRSFDLP
jgi:hypothetical protein